MAGVARDSAALICGLTTRAKQVVRFARDDKFLREIFLFRAFIHRLVQQAENGASPVSTDGSLPLLDYSWDRYR